MFEMLLWLFDCGRGKLTNVGLGNAVINGWITDAQKKEIMTTKK